MLAEPGAAPGPMHPTSWKEYSQKFVYSIMHRCPPEARESPQTGEDEAARGHTAPARCPNPLAWVGEPAVCNLKGSVAVPAHHTDFWYLTGGLARTHNGLYFPKYIILIAMMFVFISALQG